MSVQKANDTVVMYREAGFEAVDENEERYIMVCQLSCYKRGGIMTDNLDEKAVREALKKVIDNNDAIAYKAKADLKAIMHLH